MSDGSWMQNAVRAFHVAMDQPAPERLDPGGVRAELRARLILEEALEVVEALGFSAIVSASHNVYLTRVRRDADWPMVARELADLVYVALGTAVEAGFELGPFFHEVHRANMAKIAGRRTREDGKILKPEGWEPPRVRYLWDRLVERARR